MKRFVLNRLLQAVIVIVFSSMVIFVLVRAIPGNPAIIMAGPNATPAQLAATKQLLGLNLPLPLQYLTWLKLFLTGNLGISTTTRGPVSSLIGAALLPTALLVAGSFIIALISGLGLGLIASITRHKFVDVGLNGLMSVMYGAPSFWIGLLAILFFALKLHWLPVGGFVNPFTSPIAGLKSLMLPCTVLGLSIGGVQGRFVRSALKDSLNHNYVRVARAKGVSRIRVVTVHALRNALIPIVTMYGINFAALLGGSIVIETVFSWPGMGQLVVNAVSNRDYPTMQAVIMSFIAIFAIVNLLIDISYGFIDPRVRRV